METIHLVQPFTRGKGHGFVPKQAQQFSSADLAFIRAERIASDFAGVIAYSLDVDEALGEYSEPRVIVRLGEVPEL